MKNGRKNPLGIVCGQYKSSAVAGWKTGWGEAQNQVPKLQASRGVSRGIALPENFEI